MVESYEFLGWGVVVLQPGQSLGPRNMEFDEIVWIINGNVSWTCAGRQYDLSPGDITITPGGMEHHYIWDPSQETVHGFIEFSASDKLFDLVHNPGSSTSVALPMLHHILMLLDSRPTGWEELIQRALGYVIDVLIQGVDSTNPNISRRELPQSIRGIVNLLKEEWTPQRMRQIFIEELMEAAGKSKSQVIRIFKEYFNQTPAEALRRARLNHGARLLRHTNLPVKAISDITGFYSPFHFSREFSKIYNVPPSRFRLNPFIKTEYTLDIFLWGEHTYFSEF